MQPTVDQIEPLVDRILIEEFEVESDQLRREALLVTDLDLDSLDGIDLVVALEKTFKCRIPEGEARKIRTLGDIYDKIRALLEVEPIA